MTVLSLPKKFACPHCATEYFVTYKPFPTRDSGTAYCKVCRKKMIEWNDYEQPSFMPVLPSLRDDELPRPVLAKVRREPD
jgi:hypothetical protein